MPLTDPTIRGAKPRTSGFKLTDSGGLYLLVTPAGSKLWNLAFRFEGKQKKLSLGAFPAVSLAQARKLRDDARSQLAKGIDPAAQKQADKRARSTAAANTFQVIGDEWLARMEREGRAEVTITRERLILRPAFAAIGARPMADLTAAELLAVLRKVEARGTLDSAHRLRSTMSRLFRYAIATARAERDPAADLIGALPAVRTVHRPAIFDPKAIGTLLRTIDAMDGYAPVRIALRLALLTFTRPSELREAPWSEINLDAATWRVSAARMKMGRDHIVPLSRQAVKLFREVRDVTGGEGFVFPSVRTPSRPLSENTLNVALRRIGYTKDQVTVHGFRRMASTRLNEMGFNSDFIERQLAHVEGDVRGIYNAAQWIEQRTAMMQVWADTLDNLAYDEEDLIG